MSSTKKKFNTATATKLLIVCDEMEVGGSQRQIVNLLKNIDRGQFQPHVLYFRSHSYLLDELLADGIEVTHIPKYRKVDPLFLLKIVRLFWRERFDHVHCFSLTAELWCSVACLFSPKTHLHTSIRARYEWFSATEWLLKRFTTFMSTSVVSNSYSGSEYAQQRIPGLTPKLTTIYNGVVKQAQTLLPIEGNPQDRGLPLGLFVGRLVKSKNVPVLLQALEILNNRQFDFRFLIAGSGPDADDVRNEIRTRGLQSKVQMIGERSDIHALLNLADFLILPSQDEGISNTLVEAMMNGLAVIVSRIPGNSEVITDNETGLLFSPGDATELAENIQQLMLDTKMASAIGRKAQSDAAQRFNVNNMVENFMAHYRSMET